MCNALISFILFCIFAAMSVSHDADRINQLHRAGAAITAIIQLTFAAFFLLYGSLMVRAMTNDSGTPMEYAKKLGAVAVSLSTTFAVSAALLLFSIGDEDSYNTNLIAYD